MKPNQFEINDYIKLDKVGIVLSLICAIHCLLTPLVMLSLPIMARYYLANPYFHVLIGFLILPVGIAAFVSGYRHHRNQKVFWLGIPGMILISVVPLFIHKFGYMWNEVSLMVFGSGLLIWAHWINRKSCACDAHSH